MDLVYFFDEAGELGWLPAQWTDVAPVDGFVEAARGRAPFRTSSLLDLADRLSDLRAAAAVRSDSVQEITP